MKQDKLILIAKDEDLFIGTWELSKRFQVEHRALKKLVNKYKLEFEDVGFVTPAMQQIPQKKRGRTVEEFLLSEPQATYISTLLTNNQVVREFKAFLCKEFFRQRKLLAKLLAQKHNAEWYEKRASGKTERRIETDAIKEFIEYAKAQGSQNAEKYYMIITKMENQNLFQLEFLQQKYENLRDVLDGFALDSLKMADHAVGKALKEGMEENLHYKEIYVLAKNRVEMFAKAVGKMPLVAVLGKLEMKR